MSVPTSVSHDLQDVEELIIDGWPGGKGNARVYDCPELNPGHRVLAQIPQTPGLSHERWTFSKNGKTLTLHSDAARTTPSPERMLVHVPSVFVKKVTFAEVS